MLLVFPHLFPSSFNALAVWPFIILKEGALKEDPYLIQHERIHLRQQLEMLWIFFFLFYLIEFFVKLIIYKKPKLAYHNLSFEREAYTHEHDLDYIGRRPFWNFVKYL